MGKGEERSSLGIAYNDIKNFNLSNGRFYEYDICVCYPQKHHQHHDKKE